MRSEHASDFLQNLVSDVRKELETEKKQSVCAVTDSVSNVISTIEKQNEEIEDCENRGSSAFDTDESEH